MAPRPLDALFLNRARQQESSYFRSDTETEKLLKLKERLNASESATTQPRLSSEQLAEVDASILQNEPFLRAPSVRVQQEIVLETPKGSVGPALQQTSVVRLAMDARSQLYTGRWVSSPANATAPPPLPPHLKKFEDARRNAKLRGAASGLAAFTVATFVCTGAFIVGTAVTAKVLGVSNFKEFREKMATDIMPDFGEGVKKVVTPVLPSPDGYIARAAKAVKEPLEQFFTVHHEMERKRSPR